MLLTSRHQAQLNKIRNQALNAIEANQPAGTGPGFEVSTVPAAVVMDDVLTKEELAGWLKMSMKWVENNTRARRFPGQFKAGGEWRFKRIEIERNILVHKQVLLPKDRD